jgi:predicted Zn-dependent protease
MKPLKLLTYALVVTLLVACTTSPTGRRQFQLMPESQLEAMGEQTFAKMKKEEPTVSNGPSVTYANCISNAIIDVVPREYREEDWEVTVFRSEQVNAFALPGGKIGIYTGLMKVAETPDQLATVVAHEVGHVMAQHGNERVSNQLAAQIGLAVASGVAASQTEHNRELVALLGLGTQVGILLPFSRTHESEADEIGLDLMAKAGFNPEASVDLWQNMAKKKGGGPPEFLSTHPSNQSRIDNLRSQMDRARNTFRRARSEGRNPNCRRPDSFPSGDDQ